MMDRRYFVIVAAVALVVVFGALAIGSAAGEGFPWLISLGIAPPLLLLHLRRRFNREEAEQRRQHEALGRIYLDTVETLALAFDAKDPITYGHARRVRAYAAELARLAGVEDVNELWAIEMAALLHDIGKLAVDESILTKPGPLTDGEFEEMKRHSTAGSEILEHIRYPYPVAAYVRSHHERWDGGGYPDGLEGEDIPLGARILAIAEGFDATRSERPYKRAVQRQECLDAILAGAGSVYDPRLARLFVENIDRMERKAADAAGAGVELSFYRSPGSMRSRTSVDAAGSGSRSSVQTLELASLEHFCKGIGGELELNDLLATVVRRVRRIVPADTCVIYLRGVGDELTARIADGRYAPKIQGISLPWGAGLSGWVAAHQKPIANGDPQLDLEGLDEKPLGLDDSLAVPLLSGSVSIGVLAVYAGPTGTYGAGHQELLIEAARLVAGVVDRARYRESLPDDEASTDGDSRDYAASRFSAIASAQLGRAREAGTTLSIACVDFETPGSVRPLGTREENRPTLRRIAALTRAELPPETALFYFGEHRMVAVFEGVDRWEAQGRGQRLQARIRNMSLGGKRGAAVACQVAVVTCPDDGATLQGLLQAVEMRLAGLDVPEREKFLRVRKPKKARVKAGDSEERYADNVTV